MRVHTILVRHTDASDGSIWTRVCGSQATKTICRNWAKVAVLTGCCWLVNMVQFPLALATAPLCHRVYWIWKVWEPSIWFGTYEMRYRKSFRQDASLIRVYAIIKCVLWPHFRGRWGGGGVCYMASTVDHIYIDCMNKASERYKVIRCARKNNNSTCSSKRKMWAPPLGSALFARIHSASYHLPEFIFDMIFSTLGSGMYSVGVP